ncbi:MAG: PAS domain S-box protein [Anaerolineae bacterium]|jgi:PAS domain S-box-containing protein
MSDKATPLVVEEPKAGREALVEDWYRAIRQTSYVPGSAREVRHQLSHLVDQALAAIAAAPFNIEAARQVGGGLVQLHYVTAEALGRTLELFGDRLSELLPPDQATNLQPPLIRLLAEMSAGFVGQACNTVLGEQEEIRKALVTELRATEHALRQARTELEARVEERTAQLAKVNEQLRAEVAERKRTEAVLIRQEEQYRYLVENINDVIFSVGPDGLLTYVGPAVHDLLGFRPEEAVNRPFVSFVHEQDRDRVMQGYTNLMAGQVQSNEYRVRTRDGAYRWIRTSSRPVLQDDKIVGTTGLLTDIHDRKLAEIALRESEERWRSLVENAPDIILTLNREYRITFLNRAQEGSRRSAQDMLGTKVTDYLLPEHIDEARRAIQQVFDTGERALMEAGLASGADSVTWYSARLGPVRRDGKTAAVMVVARDVTERRRIAEMKDNLVRDVSHELRTPLAKAQMSLELLLEQLAKEEINRDRANRSGQMAFRSTERLLRTVEGILDLSSLEAGEDLQAIEAIRPEELIQDVTRDMQPLAEAKGLVLQTHLAEGLPPVAGEWEKLRRVLTNLVDNAIKFTDQGEIVISAQAAEHAIEFTVKDPGQGILPENLDRIFERFFQEKIRFQGAGVGLAICKAIVDAHHGQIWAESAGRGQGTVLRFTVPVMVDELE